jgi:uncharacterized protein DUF6457
MTEDQDVAWRTAVEQELGLEVDTEAQTLDALDELARQIGEDVDPELAPRTLFLVGVAAGRAADPSAAARDYAGMLAALARGWQADTERAEPANDQAARR